MHFDLSQLSDLIFRRNGIYETHQIKDVMLCKSYEQAVRMELPQPL